MVESAEQQGATTNVSLLKQERDMCFVSLSNKILFLNSNWKIGIILPLDLSMRILELNTSNKSGVIISFHMNK